MNPKCEVCGNHYDKTFEIVRDGESHIFDSFECAIHALAPVCCSCGVRIVGHGMEAGGDFYCGAHCAKEAGVAGLRDRSLGLVLLVGLLAALAGCATEEPAMQGLGIPAGDAARGRQAFVDLRCYSCHAVENDPDMPGTVSANLGPTIGTLGAQAPEHLALSIVSPSHEVPPPRDSSLSHMGDFRETMTVQQLIDVVACDRGQGTGALIALGRAA